MILSILTPSIPARLAAAAALADTLAAQIGDQPVEHLIFTDNRRRSIGAKRDALVRMARGKYVAFVDDDDKVRPDYVSSLLAAASGDPDVITFRQFAVVNGLQSEIEFRLGNPNEPFNPGGITKRNAWHVCAWRRSLAIQSTFPNSNYGEDWQFAAQLCAIDGLKPAHVDRVLHEYYHDAATTAAPPG